MDSKIAAATDLKYRPVAVIRAEEKPRAVVGHTDISARKYVRKLLGAEYLFCHALVSISGSESERGGQFS